MAILGLILGILLIGMIIFLIIKSKSSKKSRNIFENKK